MVIAVLFHADHPSLGSYYGWPIKKQLFSSRILQNANRHLKIGMGDLLLYHYAKTKCELVQLTEKTLFHTKSKWLNRAKVNDCVLNSTIFAWVIQNVTEELTEQLHQSLANFPAYLGIHEIQFSYPHHLIFFRNLMGESYRVIGNAVWVLCPMGEMEEYGTAELDELKTLGFETAELEDSGARMTIFDDYDTIEHFEQVDAFLEQTSSYFENGENDAFELCMLLTDINPKLFHSLGAAVRVAKHIQNEEDAAQIALSGRRYLEQLADVLFAPSDEKYNGRNVRKADYKNRIWAFIETSVKQNNGEQIMIAKLGKEIDRLIDLFNSAIHGEQSQDVMIRGFADLAKISLILVTLQPLYAKNPYYAYEKKLTEFMSLACDTEAMPENE